VRRAIVTAAALAVVADRIAWACISQWREDQAAAMWLGLHSLSMPVPVGLMNSVGVPNPNGLVIVAWVLSFLPNLLVVSAVLGFFQATAMKLVSGDDWIVLLPLLASLQLRGTSTELWAQWLLTACNVLFVALVAANARRPRTVWPLLAGALAMLAPMLYLAGIVNAIAYAVVWLVLFPPTRGQARAHLLHALTVAVAWLVTWRHYPFALLRGMPHGSALDALRSLVLLPAALPTIVRFDLKPLLLDDARIVPAIAYVLAAIAGAALWLQITIAAVAYFRARQADIRVIAAALLLVVAIPLSPLLGGFRWDRGERIDQAVQFLPLVLIILFLAPRLRRAAAATAIVYAVVSALAGWIAIHSQLTYRGSALSEADVPLVQKEAVVSFMRAPARYDLAGIWTWLKPHPWYPGVYTAGRAFDYELLHRYGVVNRGRPRYVVSYAFAPPPPNTSGHAIFGRLRVSLARFSDP